MLQEVTVKKADRKWAAENFLSACSQSPLQHHPCSRVYVVESSFQSKREEKMLLLALGLKMKRGELFLGWWWGDLRIAGN